MGREGYWYSSLFSSLCQPRSVTWMSQHHKACRHTLLPRRQSALSLSLSTFPFLLPPSFLLQLLSVFLILTFASVSLSLLSHLHKSSWISERKCKSKSGSASPQLKTCSESNTDLNSQPASYAFFCSFCIRRTSKSCGKVRGLVASWTSEDM